MRRISVKILALVLLLCSVNLPTIAEEQKPSVQVLLKTNLGEIRLELDPARAPLTVDNFLQYVNRYYYDGLIFHRVVKGFMIQSGGYTFDLVAKTPGDPVINESGNGLLNRRGTVAMARTSDPDSAMAQFFINVADNHSLDPKGDRPGYTVFGRVVAGMEVVDAIAAVRIQSFDRFQHIPVDPVQILSARVVTPP